MDSILNLVLMRMAQGYEEQTTIYEKLYELTEKQCQCLRSSDVDTGGLLELIGQRQELIEALEEANAEIASLKAEVCEALDLKKFNLERIKAKVPGPGAESLEEAFFSLSCLLAKIKEQDTANVQALRGHIRGTSEQMARLQKTKKAQRSYLPVPTGGGALVDYSK